MRLTVVGGGVIGLSVALRAVDRGWQVTVYDAGRRRRASDVAAGMLGSLGEGHPGEEELLAMSAESVRSWPGLLERLGDSTVRTASDSLFVAVSAADTKYLEQLARFVWSTDPAVADRLIALDAVRRVEPALSSRCQGGYLARGEMAVDNRRLLDALRRNAEAAGAVFVEEAVTDVESLAADQIVIAAGLDSPSLCPAIHLHPAKGEVLRLRRTQWSVAPPTHVVRGRIDSRGVYLVPRSDGVVVGATQYEPLTADDRTPQVGGVLDLLADACEIMPGLRTYDVVEVGAGLRPVTADGLPIIERVSSRVVVATGHGRNGIVLAPYTAARVMDLLAEEN